MSHRSLKSTIFAVTIGSALEWYDFFLYVFLAPAIARQYFPSLNAMTGLIYTSLIFAIGFLSRPIGGLLFGHIGDRHGRRIALFASIIMITVPTFGIGLLPAAFGSLMGPLLLLFLRLLQGVLTGGELPGIMCYLTEGIPQKKLRFISSMSFVGSQAGMILSIIECLILETQLTPEQFLQWGWRVSFIIGGAIGLLGGFLRSRLKETHPFLILAQHKRIARKPILESLLHHKKNLLVGISLAAVPLAGDFLLLSFSPIYFQAIHISSAQSLFIVGILRLIITLTLPLFGKLGDRYSNKILLKICCTGLLFIAYPLYASVSHFSPLAPLLGIIAILLISCYYALLANTLAELYPTSLRYSCIGLSYNTAASLFGGTAPLLALLLLEQTHNLTSPSIILIAASFISLIGISRLKERKLQT